MRDGRCPPSLLSLWGDYSPSVVGILRNAYEPNCDAYNPCFEAPSFTFGAREIVMFNPLDQREMSSHDSDLRLRTQAELVHRRGRFAAHETARPHWKHFPFDRRRASRRVVTGVRGRRARARLSRRTA